MLNINFKMHDVKIIEANYNPKTTYFGISQTKPNLRVDLEDCDFNFAFNYSIKSTPELIADNGTAKAWLKDMNLSVRASPSVNKDSYVQLEFEQLKFDVKDFGVELQGGDIALLVNSFNDMVEDFVKSYLIGTMNTETRNSLEEIVNQALSTPRELEFKNDLIDVDYSFVDEGIVVTDDYVSLALDGTFTAVSGNKNIQTPLVKKYTRMPLHDPDAAEIQFMISEYSLNSMLLTAVDLDIIKYENSD